MERATEIYAAVQFLVIGLSHVLQPRVWVDFFTWLREKGHAGGVPRWGMRSLQRVSHERAHEFVIGGVFFLALSALMAYLAITR